MSFWPPTPPPFTRDPEVKRMGSQILEELLANYRAIDQRRLSGSITAVYDGESRAVEPVVRKTITPGDPWMRNEAWRYHPYFSPLNAFKRAFPGLGIASVVFAGYCIAEYVGVV